MLRSKITRRLVVLALLVFCRDVMAGGGPRNVLVLYNDSEPEAYTTAEYYAEARAIPRDQLCALSGIDAAQLEISLGDYQSLILQRLNSCLQQLKEPIRIGYLVIVRGLPYRVKIPGAFTTSLSAMLQVYETTQIKDGTPLAGQPQFKAESGIYSPSVENPLYQKHIGGFGVFELENATAGLYTSSIRIANASSQPPSFHRGDVPDGNGYHFSGQLFVVTRLDGFDYQDARSLVDRAIMAEEQVPDAPITCMAAADDARGARDPECHYVSGLLEGAGISSEFLLEHDSALSGKTMGAYLTGAVNLKTAIDGNIYQPGAFVDNLTSFGAAPGNFVCSSDGTQCPQEENQTSIARFVRAGATAVHGSVNEPLNLCFPNAGTLLLYTMGYNVAESVFFNQRFLYWQNLLVGDPLTSPWAERPVVSIEVGEEHALARTVTVNAQHSNGLIHLALYVDGELAVQSGGAPLELELKQLGAREILAIGTAKNVGVTRLGWPQPQQIPQSDVQGWKRLLVQVGEVVVVEEPVDVAEPPPTESSSGGCSYGDVGPFSNSALVILLLLGLILIRGANLRRRC